MRLITETTVKILVESGDTLDGIAEKLGTTRERLLKLNPKVTDPNLIYSGEALNYLVTASHEVTYFRW